MDDINDKQYNFIIIALLTAIILIILYYIKFHMIIELNPQLLIPAEAFTPTAFRNYNDKNPNSLIQAGWTQSGTPSWPIVQSGVYVPNSPLTKWNIPGATFADRHL